MVGKCDFRNDTFKSYIKVKKAVREVLIVKIRIINLKPETLIQIIQGKIAAFTPNLPDDTELLDIKLDLFSNQVQAVIRSESFEDIADTYPIPEFTAAPSKTTAPKTYAPKKIVAQKSHQTSGIEEEFSPEQRELLSFSVDGDFIVVKPTQYLKTEWNEINLVVKSLGGKWVKDDMFSYWAIPVQ